MDYETGAFVFLFSFSPATLCAKRKPACRAQHKSCPESKSLLKIPKDNALPDFLKKDFLKNAPNPNASPKSFEKNIQMGEREAFIDPGDEFLERLQTPESNKRPGDFKVDQYLGDLKAIVKVFE